jgi:hypothetical protein
MALPSYFGETEFSSGGTSVYVGVVGVDGSIQHLFQILFPDHERGDGALWGIDQWEFPDAS